MKKILLTRLQSDNSEDIQYFEQSYQCIALPLLELQMRPVDKRLSKQLAQAEWIFLTSQHSSKFFIRYFSALLSPAELRNKKFAVIGQKTAAVLTAAGLTVSFLAETPSKEGLFTTWQRAYPERTTIFYPKSNLADDKGEAEFLKRGYQLSTAVLYDNLFPEQAAASLNRLLAEKGIDGAYFTSPSLWHRFYSVYKNYSEVPLTFYCVGRTTQEVIQAAGFTAKIKPSSL